MKSYQYILVAILVSCSPQPKTKEISDPLTYEKMREIIIPELNVKDTPIDEVYSLLNEQLEIVAPQYRLNYAIPEEQKGSFSINVKEVSLFDIMETIETFHPMVSWRIQGNMIRFTWNHASRGIYFFPISYKEDYLQLGADPKGSEFQDFTEKIEEILIREDMGFKEGTLGSLDTAFYVPSSQTLYVRCQWRTKDFLEGLIYRKLDPIESMTNISEQDS